LSKWLEIWTVDFWEHLEDTIILVEFIMHFLYVFMIPPNYLNKLRKCIKRIYLGMGTMFSGVH
jgi:hypothetical protein